MVLSKRTICSSKKSRFFKNEEEKGLLSSLGFRISLSKVSLLGDILSGMQFPWVQLGWEYKISELVNKFLLAGDRFMTEMHLKQLGFT